jgi:Zn-dependent M16 (insulinase) family peptidase
MLSVALLSLPSRSFSARPVGFAGFARAASVFGARPQSSIAAATLGSTLADVCDAPPATHPAFDLLKSETVAEYNVRTTTYRHTKSGAELLSIKADDDNKVFMVSFRTPPTRSDGVAHILEHSVLCGSKKYPTKEPFVELIKGSLNTFLNAFTYPDRTCYPVASLNTKDFRNLVNVYLDAVFHPRAKTDPMVHAQEGWHLEAEDVSDDLVYKGVVFNEMKGVYSQPDSLLNRESMRSLFPDNAYGVDSGGDPKDIVKLSFDEFAGEGSLPSDAATRGERVEPLSPSS